MKKIIVFIIAIIPLFGFSQTLIDSYTDGSGYLFINSTGYTKLGQSFTNTSSDTLYSVEVKIRKYGSPTGNITVYIYAHSGTFGAAGSVPTGSALATSGTKDISTLTTSYTWTTFSFSGANKIALSANTHYFAVIEYAGGDGNNALLIQVNGDTPAHAGSYAYYSGSWLNEYADTDLLFKVYNTVVVSTSISKINGVLQSSVSKVNGTTKANIKKVNGVSNQ